MNKSIYILAFALIGMSVSCEKSDWFSPDEVDAIKAGYTTQVNDLQFANNALTSQVTDLTTQVTSLTTEVETLTASVSTLTTSNTTLTDANAALSEADQLEADIVTLKDFKSLRDKLDVMVAATITDTNLNKAIDSISIGLTSTSLTPSVLDGLIGAEADWLFDNAIKSGTVSMTSAVSTFYDTSADTNVVNFRTLVTELTAAWNAAKESQLILWFIEFINEYENL